MGGVTRCQYCWFLYRSVTVYRKPPVLGGTTIDQGIDSRSTELPQWRIHGSCLESGRDPSLFETWVECFVETPSGWWTTGVQSGDEKCLGLGTKSFKFEQKIGHRCFWNRESLGRRYVNNMFSNLY